MATSPPPAPLALLVSVHRFGPLGRWPGMAQPLRQLKRELKGMAALMLAAMPLIAMLLLGPLLLFALPILLEPTHSLHCQRGRMPQHDHCLLVRLHPVAFSLHTLSFSLTALQQAQLHSVPDTETVTMEQLVLVLSTPARPGTSTHANGTLLALSPLDLRPKDGLMQRINRFRHDNEQDRFDLLILPMNVPIVLMLTLAIPGYSFVLWLQERFHLREN